LDSHLTGLLLLLVSLRVTNSQLLVFWAKIFARERYLRLTAKRREAAEEGSQGQARSEAERAAPGYAVKGTSPERATEASSTGHANYFGDSCALSARGFKWGSFPGAARFASLRDCPWLPYFAPSARGGH
jgi:hypothetical protein